MNLRCALICGADTWKQILVQCGIPAVEAHRTSLERTWASVLVVDGRLSSQDAELVRGYLADGGAVIGATEDLAPAIGMSLRREAVRYLIDDGSSPWCDIIDLDTVCSIPREANRILTDKGVPSVFAGEWGGGYAVMLPFNLQSVWERPAARYRQFPARFDRLPYEKVSVVSRAEISRLIGKAIEFLHHRRGLPYVRLWPFPDGAPSVVAVRLDTDRATSRQIEAFAQTSSDAGVPFTWFVDTGSHRGFLDLFSSLPEQEVGIHCYRHRVYQSVDDYRTDIRLARTDLARVGVTPVGYAAPFGEWSVQLGEAVDDSRVAYSSEFGIGYDGFPFTFRARTKRFTTPQVPVHPVSTGALRRAGYSRRRMTQYYSALLRRNVAVQQPFILLDHPVHENQDVLRQVAEEALGLSLKPVRIGDYVSWWQRRERVLQGTAFAWDGSAVSKNEGGGGETSIMVSTTTAHGETLAPLDALGEAAIPAGRPTTFMRSVDDIRRSREFDLRTAIGVGTTVAMRRIFR